MFIKQGKDFIYVCKQSTVDKENEVKLFGNQYFEIWQSISEEDYKTVNYFRIVLLTKNTVKVMPKTLFITIPKTKLQHKVLFNNVINNFIAVHCCFGNTSYITIGKLCTEKNV